MSLHRFLNPSLNLTFVRTRIKPAAAAFAPRLHELHTALDQAVCAAYGWDAAILNDEEAMLEALLRLNQARAASK